MLGRRVAVTGIGVVAKAGLGKDEFWKGLIGDAPEGSRFIEDWDASSYFDNPKDARRSDRYTQFALAAATEAIAQAGDITTNPARRGTSIGTGIGGIGSLETQIEVRLQKGEKRVSPFLVPMMMPNAAPAAVSMRFGWQGPCENTVTACAAGTHAIGNGARMVADGRCDVVIAGGAEAPFTPTAIAGFANMTALSSSGVSMPFDAKRDGFVMGEGCGLLVLEAWDVAIERGATILGEILGSASTADAHHITAPAPGGTGAVSCMQLAIKDAGLTAADIGHVNAHGTSTSKNDAAEAEAVAKVFGTDGGPLITSTKGITGHALGAAGALEAVAVLLSMHHKLIPPTAGLTEPDPDLPTINLVMGEPKAWTPAPSLSNSFGFGGHNGTLVLGPA
ncbi:MAG: beta-ketoacyl-[acyl-carrier-protein] synthase family protein [Acidimicrobiales bacterium]|jgi:3-oxoacyl-[acyl-carrier-protein] synthase II